jgi:hypothetical protein
MRAVGTKDQAMILFRRLLHRIPNIMLHLIIAIVVVVVIVPQPPAVSVGQPHVM